MELSAFKYLALTTLFAMAMIGGLMPLRFRGSRSVTRILSLGNMFAGGIFLGGGLLHLLPEAHENYENAMKASDPSPHWPELLRVFPVAFWLCGIGFFAVLVVEEGALAWTAAKQRKLAEDHKRGLAHSSVPSTAVVASIVVKKPNAKPMAKTKTAGADSAASTSGTPLLSAASHDDAAATQFSSAPLQADSSSHTSGQPDVVHCHANGASCELAAACVLNTDAEQDGDQSDGNNNTASVDVNGRRLSSHLQAELDRALAARVITGLAPRSTLRGTDSPPATPRQSQHPAAYGAVVSSTQAVMTVTGVASITSAIDASASGDYKADHYGHSHGATDDPHSHGHGGEGHDHFALDPAMASGIVAYVLVMALSFHSVFEGIAFGTQSDMSSAVALYVAIAAHTPLAGFALGVSLVKAQAPTTTVVACITLFSVTVPAGTLLGLLFSAVLNGAKLDLVSACTQAFASGTFLFVALGEIIPKELSAPRDKGWKVLLCLLGFTGMALIKLFDN